MRDADSRGGWELLVGDRIFYRERSIGAFERESSLRHAGRVSGRHNEPLITSDRNDRISQWHRNRRDGRGDEEMGGKRTAVTGEAEETAFGARGRGRGGRVRAASQVERRTEG